MNDDVKNNIYVHIYDTHTHIYIYIYIYIYIWYIGISYIYIWYIGISLSLSLHRHYTYTQLIITYNNCTIHTFRTWGYDLFAFRIWLQPGLACEGNLQILGVSGLDSTVQWPSKLEGSPAHHLGFKPQWIRWKCQSWFGSYDFWQWHNFCTEHCSFVTALSL